MGLFSSYRGSWCNEGLNTPWNSTWRVLGSKGTVAWDGGEGFKAQAVKPDSPVTFNREQLNLEVPMLAMTHANHVALMHEFVAAVQVGKTPETICQDNIKSLAMVLAAVESAKTGKKVNVVW